MLLTTSSLTLRRRYNSVACQLTKCNSKAEWLSSIPADTYLYLHAESLIGRQVAGRAILNPNTASPIALCCFIAQHLFGVCNYGADVMTPLRHRRSSVGRWTSRARVTHIRTSWLARNEVCYCRLLGHAAPWKIRISNDCSIARLSYRWNRRHAASHTISQS